MSNNRLPPDVLINIKEEVAFELGLRQRAETQEEDQQIEEQAAAAIPETPVDESITMQEFEKHLLQYDGISTDRRPALSALVYNTETSQIILEVDEIIAGKLG